MIRTNQQNLILTPPIILNFKGKLNLLFQCNSKKNLHLILNKWKLYFQYKYLHKRADSYSCTSNVNTNSYLDGDLQTCLCLSNLLYNSIEVLKEKIGSSWKPIQSHGLFLRALFFVNYKVPYLLNHKDFYHKQQNLQLPNLIKSNNLDFIEIKHLWEYM